MPLPPLELPLPSTRFDSVQLQDELIAGGIPATMVYSNGTNLLIAGGREQDFEAATAIVSNHVPPPIVPLLSKNKLAAKALLSKTDNPERLMLYGILKVLYDSISEIRTKVGLTVRPWEVLLMAVRQRIDDFTE